MDLSACLAFIQDFSILAPLKGTMLRAVIVLLWLSTTAFVLHIGIQVPGNLILWLMRKPLLRTKFNRYVCRLWSHFLLVHLVPRPKIVLSGDRYNRRDSYLVSSNHQVDTDWIWHWMVAQRNHRHGNLIIMLKEAFKYVPFFGPAMLLFGYVFIKREWERDRHTMEATLGHLLKEQDPFWVLIFPEGTRFKQSSLDLARRFADERHMRAPNHVLLPRYKGLNSTMGILGERFDTFMDVTMRYDVPTTQATILEISKGLGPTTVYLHLQASPIHKLPSPEDEAALVRYWYKTWEKKDQLLEDFDREGKFPGPSYELPVVRDAWHVNLVIFLVFIANLWLIAHFVAFFLISLVLFVVILSLVLRLPS